MVGDARGQGQNAAGLYRVIPVKQSRDWCCRVGMKEATVIRAAYSAA